MRVIRSQKDPSVQSSIQQEETNNKHQQTTASIKPKSYNFNLLNKKLNLQLILKYLQMSYAFVLILGTILRKDWFRFDS